MASNEAKYGLLAQAKKQPGKTGMLAFLMLMMAVVWSRNLIGSDEESKAPPKPSPNAGMSAATLAGLSTSPNAEPSTASAAPVSVISNYKMALQRLESWRLPLGLEKAEPLTAELLAERKEAARMAALSRTERTEQARLARQKAEADGGSRLDLSADALLQSADRSQTAMSAAQTTGPEQVQSGGSALRASAAEAPPISIDQTQEIDLKLTGTAIFGKNRYAMFGTRTVQEGQRIGRYLVKAVRSREVDLVAEGSLTVIRIAPPDLELNQP